MRCIIIFCIVVDEWLVFVLRLRFIIKVIEYFDLEIINSILGKFGKVVVR